MNSIDISVLDEQLYLIKFPIENKKGIILNNKLIAELSQEIGFKYNKLLVYWLFLYSYCAKIGSRLLPITFYFSVCFVAFYTRNNKLLKHTYSESFYRRLHYVMYIAIASGLLKLIFHFELIPILSPNYYWKSYSVELFNIKRELEAKQITQS